MIEAELKHKIVKIEDTLTSSVFGMLKHRFMVDVLEDFTGNAIKYNNPNIRFIEEINKNKLFEDKYEFKFWERAGEYGEPDLIIEGDNYVILIEVKDESDISSEDQLKKYYEYLEIRYKSKLNLYLIFLTKDIFKPEIEEIYITTIKNKNFYWLSWYELYYKLKDILKEEQSPKSEISKDILRLLKEGRNIMLFEGFSDYEDIKLDEPVLWKQEKEFVWKFEDINLTDLVFWKGANNE